MTQNHPHLHVPHHHVHLEFPETVTITLSDAVALLDLWVTLLKANPQAMTSRDQRNALGVLKRAVQARKV